MRVLVISDWNPGRGGAEAYVGWLRRALAEAGEEVRLLTGSAGTAGDGMADHVAFASRNPAAQVFLQIVNPWAVREVWRAKHAFRPDVAHVNLFEYHLSPAILPALSGVPIVAGIHDYKSICLLGTKMLPDGSPCTQPLGGICRKSGCVGTAHWLRDQVRYALIARWQRRVARRVVYSLSMQRGMAGHGIATHHIPYPIDPPGPDFRRRPAAMPTFLFVGRIEREKGVEMSVEAMAIVHRAIPRARWVFVGTGSLESKLTGECRRLGLRDSVEFAGWLDSRGVSERMSTAWALVAPSLWAEPFGMVAPEAILRGLPVIASEHGGLAESIEAGLTGLTFPNGDVAALAARMLAVADGSEFPGRTCDAGAMGRLRSRHDPGTHLGKLVACYREVAGAGLRARLKTREGSCF